MVRLRMYFKVRQIVPIDGLNIQGTSLESSLQERGWKIFIVMHQSE